MTMLYPNQCYNRCVIKGKHCTIKLQTLLFIRNRPRHNTEFAKQY